MPNLAVGFVTVYKCLIFVSIQYGYFACIVCRRALFRFQPEPKHRLHLYVSRNIRHSMNANIWKVPLLSHDWFFPNLFQSVIQYYLNIWHFRTYSKLLPASSHTTYRSWNSSLS